MLLKDPDHTCLTFYNKKQEEDEDQVVDKVDRKEERKKEAAVRAIKNLGDRNMLSCLSHKKIGVEGKDGRKNNPVALSQGRVQKLN